MIWKLRQRSVLDQYFLSIYHRLFRHQIFSLVFLQQCPDYFEIVLHWFFCLILLWFYLPTRCAFFHSFLRNEGQFWNKFWLFCVLFFVIKLLKGLCIVRKIANEKISLFETEKSKPYYLRARIALWEYKEFKKIALQCTLQK